MFEQYNGTEEQQAPYPKDQIEAENIVAQVVNLIHSEEMGQGIAQAIQRGSDNPIETLANIGAQIAAKVVQSIEGQTGRDILPETELGILAMCVEELATLAANFSLKVNESMVSNIVNIASDLFNQMMQGGQGPQAQQGPPQQALGGM